MAGVAERLTAHAYLAREDPRRTELIDGVVVVLDEGNVLAPDVLWFDGELPLDAANAPRAPDLVVEVRSASTWRYDVGRKRELYERHGVQELWLADTASRTMLVYRRSSATSGFDDALELTAEQAVESRLLPGLSLRVGDLLPAA